MLRTNSKAARQAVREYIAQHYDGSSYDLPEARTFEEIARNTWDIFQQEKRHELTRNLNRQFIFIDWLQGLPSIIDPAYYYRESAIDALGDILQETQAERSKYTETDAEKYLSYLIYSEIEKTANK